MNRDSKSIFTNYKFLNEQRTAKIGRETVNLDQIINAVDKSKDLPLDIKNTLKSILMTQMGQGQAGPVPTPSAMTQTPAIQPQQPQPIPPMQSKMPMAMI